MKAERINQDQIRFTLSESDLLSRNLQMSELSYGSDKTKALFEEMMHTAFEQFGIDFSQKPMMIEAIPLSERSLTITVTRVSGAAELGALFGANFSDAREPHFMDGNPGNPWSPVWNAPQGGPVTDAEKGQKEDGSMSDFPMNGETVIYLFDRLEDLLTAAAHAPASLKLVNALYSEEARGCYYLMVSPKKADSDVRYTLSLLAHFANEWFWGRHAELLVKEHAKLSIKARALQKLGEIERMK